MPLWTQAVRVQWRPELRFFEERTQLLRELADLDLLRAFQWRDQTIGARLGHYEVIEVGSTGALISLTSPKASPDRLHQALKVTLRRVDAKDVTAGYTTLQYLLPLTTDGRTVQRASAEVFVPEVAPEGRGMDWAMLLDGSSVALGTAFQVEYGVLRNDEMAYRLSGRAARQPAAVDTQGHAIDFDDLPDSAAFFDWRWLFQERLGDGDVSEAVFRLWGAAVDESERFNSRIQGRLGVGITGTDRERVEADG